MCNVSKHWGLKFSLWRQHSAVAFLGKRAYGLEFGKNFVYKCFFRVIFHCRSPQAGIIKLEWWVKANVWKKPEVRNDLTMIGTPKTFASKHGGSWVRLSLCPFCGWIPRPAKAIWTTFDFQTMQSVQYFAGRIGCLDTYKNVWKKGLGGLACMKKRATWTSFPGHCCFTQAFLSVTLIALMGKVDPKRFQRATTSQFAEIGG